ncbi:response regulator [Candidatus Nomurabacteria bacterium]|nr:response regulator [Candidatus Nomurabacteria bacterium]
MSEKKKILIAEDDQRIVNSYKLLFRFQKSLADYSLFWAETATQAQSLFLDEKPDLTLLDLGLGDGIPGYDVLKNLQGRVPDSCRIVVLSGYSEYEDMCLASGATAFLKKPLTKDQFLATILEHTR